MRVRGAPAVDAGDEDRSTGLHAANGRTEVLRDRIAELEQRERDLDRANADLHAELARNPVLRVARTIRRRLSRPS